MPEAVWEAADAKDDRDDDGVRLLCCETPGLLELPCVDAK
jgi:hypothetical protein